MSLELQRKIILILLVCAIGGTAVAQGFGLSGVGYVTVSSGALAIGAILIMVFRVEAGKAMLPIAVLEIPVVVATLIYFVLGLSTYDAADDKFLFYKEVLQRTLIVLAPLYFFSLGPKKASELKWAFLSLLAVGVPIALFSFGEAYLSHFSRPVYAFGMHKNQIAGTCACMAVVAIAGLLTSKSNRKRFVFGDIVLVSIMGCLGTQGRAGLICTVVATVFMLIAIRANPKQILRFILAVSVGAVMMSHFLPKETIEKALSNDKYSSSQIRVTLWTDIYPLLIKEPFRAVGWGNPRIEGAYYYGDVANVLLFDWMQMGILGAVALTVVIIFAIKLPLDNAVRMPTDSLLAFINLCALGIICVRFTHGMLDTFWIGRGVNLITWMAIGVTVFVKLLLDQTGAKPGAHTVRRQKAAVVSHARHSVRQRR